MSEEFPDEAAAFRQLLESDAGEPVAAQLDAGLTRRRLRNQRLARGGVLAVVVGVVTATTLALALPGQAPETPVIGVPAEVTPTPTVSEAALWQRIADRPADASASGTWIAGDFYYLDLASGGTLLRGYGYHPDTDTWRALPDLQVAIAAAEFTVVEADSDMYVLLTTDTAAEAPVASVLARYDTTGGFWRQDAGPTLAANVGSLWVQAVDRGLAIEFESYRYWYYDIDRGAWQEFSLPIPGWDADSLELVDPATGQVVRTIEWTERCHFSGIDFSTDLDGEAYLAIPASLSEDPNGETVCRYDMATNTWEELPVPPGVWWASQGGDWLEAYLGRGDAWQLDFVLYQPPQYSSLRPRSQASIYDAAADTWYTLDALPDPVVSGAPFEPLSWQVRSVGPGAIMVCLQDPIWNDPSAGTPDYKQYSVPAGLENACYLARPDISTMLHEYRSADDHSNRVTLEVTLGEEYPDSSCTLDGGSCRFVHFKTSGMPTDVRTSCFLRVEDPRYEVPAGELKTTGFGGWYWVGDHDRDIDHTVVPILVSDTTESIYALCGGTDVTIEP
ncbi:MAG: N-acetyltransferase [Propionibacteriaceae bacterium]|jgi:hypothetical protein|nr:N-acetyltransferase [Propionibacteriaceae bacterium]